MWAGAAVVGISFIMMTIFASHRTGPTALQYPRREGNVLAWLPGSPWLHWTAGLVGLVVLLAAVLPGLFGPVQPGPNPALLLARGCFSSRMAGLTGLVGPPWVAGPPPPGPRVA